MNGDRQFRGKSEPRRKTEPTTAAHGEGVSTGRLDILETPKSPLAEEQEKAANYLSNWQRTQADFVNLKRRTEQEKSDTAKQANAALILSLLPALDDLERALGTVPPSIAGSAWFDGLKLILSKLRASLESQGLATVSAMGEEFDPNLHHAVLYEEGEEGKILQELQKGYRLYDRVIQPAMVAVGRGVSTTGVGDKQVKVHHHTKRE